MKKHVVGLKTTWYGLVIICMLVGAFLLGFPLEETGESPFFEEHVDTPPPLNLPVNSTYSFTHTLTEYSDSRTKILKYRGNITVREEIMLRLERNGSLFPGYVLQVSIENLADYLDALGYLGYVDREIHCLITKTGRLVAIPFYRLVWNASLPLHAFRYSIVTTGANISQDEQEGEAFWAFLEKFRDSEYWNEWKGLLSQGYSVWDFVNFTWLWNWHFFDPVPLISPDSYAGQDLFFPTFAENDSMSPYLELRRFYTPLAEITYFISRYVYYQLPFFQPSSDYNSDFFRIGVVATTAWQKTRKYGTDTLIITARSFKFSGLGLYLTQLNITAHYHWVSGYPRMIRYFTPSYKYSAEYWFS
ncbi:MAG: hypothetical protein ACFFDT_13285 [Candidatus Hodarchaeota archaeon]